MSKKYLQLVLPVIFFLLSTNLFTQQKTTEQTLQGFDEYVTKAISDWKVQGCGIAIVKNGAVIYAKGFGYRDVKNNLPADENTLFAIGSCTKAFTSTGVCILVDQGKIDLDKPVISYIPTFRLYDDYATMNITPRDLMCHRSGLPRHDFVWYGSDFSRKEIIDRLRYLEPSKPFRTTFQYQNMMFLTAGYLTEQVSGMQWEDYIKENILTPLDMSNTDFTVKAMQQTSDYSKPYRDEKGTVKEIPFRDIPAMAPAGAINSNVKEMANWIIMQLNNGNYNGKQIVTSSSMNEMHTPQMVSPGGMNKDVFYHSYGLGWDITSYRGHLRVEHGGNIDGFTAEVALYPMDSIGIVVLANMENTTLVSIVRNYAMDKFFGLEEIDWSARFFPDFKKSEENNNEEESNKDKDRVPDTEP
jgi:CubicO group peptidase (beta-lactamase class C family)